MTKTLVVIPTYNEAKNLPRMVETLLGLGVPGLGILVVDDNSPDGTGQIADRLASVHPGQVMVLHRPVKDGLGRAYIAGFRAALAAGAERVIQMDADFSHPPEVVPVLIQESQQWDVVVGSRYVAGGRLDVEWSTWRRFLSWWANSVYARWVLGLQVKDATAGFKCFRADVLAAIDLDRICSNGYVFQVEIAHICQKQGYRVKEVPIYFRERADGVSKLSWPVNVEAALRVWQVKWRYRKLKPAKP